MSKTLVPRFAPASFAQAAHKFLHGHALLWSLRVALGIFLPTLTLLLLSGQPVFGLAAGASALFVGLIDQPGTLAAKSREMSLCALAVTGSAALTLLGMQSTPLLWLVVLLISAAGAYAAQFGPKAGIIGLNAIVEMSVALSLHGASHSIGQMYLAGVAAGAIWYVVFGLTAYALTRHAIQRRVLADALFATADQFRARARCYDPAIADRESGIALLASQNSWQQRHLQTRELILGELANAGDAQTPAQLRLFNLCVDYVALSDLILAVHTDFAALKQHPDCHALLRQLRDILEHGAQRLDVIAAAISLGRRPRRFGFEPARMRALEQALGDLPPTLPASIAHTLHESVERVRGLRRQIVKLAHDFRSWQNNSGYDIRQVLRFYSKPAPLFTRPVDWLARPAASHSLRLSCAVLIALGLAFWRHGGHDNWIVLTVALALRPSFGQSWQRSGERVTGTVLGCALAVGVLALSHDPWVLLPLLFISLMLSLGLAAFNYQLATALTSMTVIWLYFLLSPSAKIIEVRLLDTLFGAVIALGCSHLWPDWEAMRIQPKSAALVQALTLYLERLAVLTPMSLIAWRAAQREAMTALMQLANSRDSMLLEPENTHFAVQTTQDLLLLCQTFLALGNSVAERLLNGDADDELRAEVVAAQTALREKGAPSGIPFRENAHLPECAMGIAQTLAIIQSRRWQAPSPVQGR